MKEKISIIAAVFLLAGGVFISLSNPESWLSNFTKAPKSASIAALQYQSNSHNDSTQHDPLGLEDFLRDIAQDSTFIENAVSAHFEEFSRSGFLKIERSITTGGSSSGYRLYVQDISNTNYRNTLTADAQFKNRFSKVYTKSQIELMGFHIIKIWTHGFTAEVARNSEQILPTRGYFYLMVEEPKKLKDIHKIQPEYLYLL